MLCNHLEEEERAVALLLLSYRCLVTVNVLWLFLAVPCVSLRCVIVVFPGHTHLLFEHAIRFIYLEPGKRKEEGKDWELIQSSTTPDPGHTMGK